MEEKKKTQNTKTIPLQTCFLHKNTACCCQKLPPSPSLCQPLDWLSHPLHHHSKQTIAPSERLKSRMHDSTRLLKWVLLSPWGFPHQSQHNRNSQLFNVCWPLEVGVDLVADIENNRCSFIQDRCSAASYWPVDFSCCDCFVSLASFIDKFPYSMLFYYY